MMIFTMFEAHSHQEH